MKKGNDSIGVGLNVTVKFQKIIVRSRNFDAIYGWWLSIPKQRAGYGMNMTIKTPERSLNIGNMTQICFHVGVLKEAIEF